MTVNLTFYGGVNEIGGNKILLEDDGRKLLLDFGFPYGRHKLFYEEFLKPRGGAGLLDPLTMGLLPPLNGIYRDDYEISTLWQSFLNQPFYREIKGVDGILLSHAHLDHSGHISFLKDSTPVFCTGMSAFIAKAIQDSGKADFDQQVCYFSPTIKDCPTGLRQEAHLSGGSNKKQRAFCIGDNELAALSPQALQFWSSGFWEKTGRQKELDSSPLGNHRSCSFNVKCLPVDHSIPGACAWAIETNSGWVIYSGDLRLHGNRGKLTERFIEEAAKLKPKAMIIEGTNVKRDKNVSESMVYENGLAAIKKATGLVIADFSPRDLDRLTTFLRIAKETKRKLVILARDAYLLKTASLLDSSIPNIDQEGNLLIYQETTASRSPAIWLRNLYQEYADKIVLAGDIRSAYDQFILCFSFFDLNELPSIGSSKGSLYVFSSSEPHDEEQEIDFRRLHNWLNHFGIMGFGLPLESNGTWEIPEEQRGLHASGHACGSDLLEIAKQINPEFVIPVHTQYPEFYTEQLTGGKGKVIIPSLGIPVQI